MLSPSERIKDTTQTLALQPRCHHGSSDARMPARSQRWPSRPTEAFPASRRTVSRPRSSGAQVPEVDLLSIHDLSCSQGRALVQFHAMLEFVASLPFKMFVVVAVYHNFPDKFGIQWYSSLHGIKITLTCGNQRTFLDALKLAGLGCLFRVGDGATSIAGLLSFRATDTVLPSDIFSRARSSSSEDPLRRILRVCTGI